MSSSSQESEIGPEEQTATDSDHKLSLENLNLDELKTLVSIW